jgi:outer membrane protein
MLRRLFPLLVLIGAGSAVVTAGAQQAPPAAAPATQQTPPISPKTQETPIPSVIEIPAPPLPADVPNRPLTAAEAARIALRRQPDVDVARAGIAAAHGRTQQTRAGLLPTLNVNGGYTNVSILSGRGGAVIASSGSTTGGGSTGGTTGGTGTGEGTTGGTTSGSGSTGGTGTSSTTSTTQSTGFTATATLRQLLFDFNHTRDLVRQSEALERAAAQNLTRVQEDLVFQVKQAFYQYVQNTRLVAVNEGNLTNRQSQLALARARLNSGLGLPADMVTAETAVSEAVLNLNVARNAASLARVNLAALMGIDPRTPLQANETGEPAFPSDDVNALVNTALRQRPEVLQALATVQANQSGVSAARTTNAPVVSGSLGLSSRGADFPPRDDSFIVGASVSFNPFDGGLTAGRVREARANLQAAQAQLQSAQLTVTSDVAQAYFNLRTAEQRVLTADIEVANATEGVRIAQGRYTSGLGQFLDIINAQAQLLTASTNRVNAQFAVDQARAAIARAIGSPLPAPQPK